MLQRIHKLVQSLTSPKAPNVAHSLRQTLCSATELTFSRDSPNSLGIPIAKTHKGPTPTGTALPVENDPDIDNLCEILKKRHPSVDSVVEALNGCTSAPSNGLISRLLKRFANDWVRAFGVFTWAKHRTGCVHTPELYDSMVDVLGKCKKFSLMWDIVQEMVGIGGHVSLATMSKVMRRLTRAGKYDEAIEAFRSIEKFGVAKDAGALNVLMGALVHRGKRDEARSVLMEFRESGTPDLTSFNILLNGYCKARMLDDARRVMDEMERQGFRPDVISYTCLVEAYCKMKDFEGVEAALAEMQEKGCNPNAVTYTTVMHYLVKEKKVDQALQVCERMKRECVPDASLYSSLIFILCRCGRHRDAWDAFDDMRKQGFRRDLVTYNCMISSVCARLREENALELLQAMEEDSCRPDLRTYAPLLKMCCKLKRMKLLKYLLGHMFKNDVSIDHGTYSLLVHELCQAGKLEYAAFFFSEMVSKGMVPRYGTFSKLVEELERKNLTELKGKIDRLMLRVKEGKLPD